MAGAVGGRSNNGGSGRGSRAIRRVEGLAGRRRGEPRRSRRRRPSTEPATGAGLPYRAGESCGSDSGGGLLKPAPGGSF
jgi:hypothetical protein